MLRTKIELDEEVFRAGLWSDGGSRNDREHSVSCCATGGCTHQLPGFPLQTIQDTAARLTSELTQQTLTLERSNDTIAEMEVGGLVILSKGQNVDREGRNINAHAFSIQFYE